MNTPNDLLDNILCCMGLIRRKRHDEQQESLKKKLNFARSIGKRLDEHREVVEAIKTSTSFLQEKPWHVSHLAIQDDFLMRLYFMVHGEWPQENESGSFNQHNTNEYVRPRPPILGPCSLPEFRNQRKEYSK